MKKLFFFLFSPFLFLPQTSSAESTKTVFNPFSGKLDFITPVNGTNFASGTGVTVTCTAGVCTFSAAGTSASNLEVFSGPTRSSPTPSISIDSNTFTSFLHGATYYFTLNPATTNFIHNQTTTQTGANITLDNFVVTPTSVTDYGVLEVGDSATGFSAHSRLSFDPGANNPALNIFSNRNTASGSGIFFFNNAGIVYASIEAAPAVGSPFLIPRAGGMNITYGLTSGSATLAGTVVTYSTTNTTISTYLNASATSTVNTQSLQLYESANQILCPVDLFNTTGFKLYQQQVSGEIDHYASPAQVADLEEWWNSSVQEAGFVDSAGGFHWNGTAAFPTAGNFFNGSVSAGQFYRSNQNATGQLVSYDLLGGINTFAGTNTFTSSITVNNAATISGDVGISTAGANGRLSLVCNTADPFCLTMSTSTTGLPIMTVSSTPARAPTDYVLQVASPTTGALLFGVQLAGNVISSGTTPTVSSCGTSPTMGIATNFAGTINTGSGSPTACTLTFANGGFAATPTCVVTDDLQTAEPAITSRSATAITITLGAALNSGHIFFICVGNQ